MLGPTPCSTTEYTPILGVLLYSVKRSKEVHRQYEMVAQDAVGVALCYRFVILSLSNLSV